MFSRDACQRCLPEMFARFLGLAVSIACHTRPVPIQPHQKFHKRKASWLGASAFEVVVIRSC